MTKAVSSDSGGLTVGGTAGTFLGEILVGVAAALETVSHGTIRSDDLHFDIPPSPEMGDLAVGMFPFAKAAKKSPADFAAELAESLQPTRFVRAWTASGPYLNIALDRAVVSRRVLDDAASQASYGRGSSFENEVVVLEYVQPNTNKPLHLGHLRNAVLALSAASLIEWQGGAVKRVNIVNDRGIHIVKSMLAYERWGNGETPELAKEKGDHFVGRYYVRFEQELAKEKAAWLKNHSDETEDAFLKASELMRDARDLLQRWEQNDADVRALWERMNAWVLAGFHETYAKLGISFVKEYFESDIYNQGKEIILSGLAKGVFVKSENGAVVASLSKTSDLPDKVLLRADGTSLYITQDIALAHQRLELNPTQLVYVVGSEQELYFKQLFAVLRLLKFPAAEKLVHLSYGLVFLPEGKMKSREGKVVDADDLVAEVEALAEKELRGRYPELYHHGEPIGEPERRKKIIALAAIKFHFLMVGRTSPVHFDPKESLSFEGNTGPYVQYTYARATSILTKAGEPSPKPPETLPDISASEWGVIRLLLEYPHVLTESAKRYDPSSLCTYLLNLAQAFNAFYHHDPVLDAQEPARAFRLMLVASLRSVLKSGLAALGVETLEVM